jgi:hypothetical protein
VDTRPMKQSNDSLLADKKRLEDVFKTVGLPPYTYVKPAYYGEVRTDIRQAGRGCPGAG